MYLLNYIIWNLRPEIFTLPFLNSGRDFSLSWFGLLFASGFFISQQLLYRMYKKEGKPEKEVDVLTIYLVVASLLGARLGYIIFYDPVTYLNDPSRIFKVLEADGLAGYGAGIVVLLALWIYTKRKKDTFPGYLHLLDRIAILVALTGVFIRLGNFAGGEAAGKPTHTGYGVIHTQPVTGRIRLLADVDRIGYAQTEAPTDANGYKPVKILIDYAQNSEDYAYSHAALKRVLNHPAVQEQMMVDNTLGTALYRNDDGHRSSIISTYMIPRYPVQLYEALICLLLFIVLFRYWQKKRETLVPGRIFGFFLAIYAGTRFLLDFLRQAPADTPYAVYTDQVLSVLFLLTGVIILILSFRKKTADGFSLE